MYTCCRCVLNVYHKHHVMYAVRVRGPETHHILFRLLNEIINIDVGGVGYYD